MQSRQGTLLITLFVMLPGVFWYLKLHQHPRIVVEVLLIGAVIYFTLRFSSIKSIFGPIHPFYRAVAVLVFVLVVAGVLRRDSRRTFPFVPFPMYSEVKSWDKSFYAYSIKTSNGEWIDFDFGWAMPSLVEGQLTHAISVQAKRIELAKDQATKAKLLAEHLSLLRTVGRVYNSISKDKYAEVLSVSKKEMIGLPPGPIITTKLLWETEISE